MDINEILEHFSRFIEGFIFNDIRKSIAANTNFLTSLGLVLYTEFIGGLITGNGGKKSHSEKNFYAAYDRLGEDYKKFNKQIIKTIKKKDGAKANFYNVVRCGLVHEFFIKAPAIIAKNNYSKEAPGIGWSNGRIAIANNNYFRDFKKMCLDYKEELINNEELQSNFDKCFEDKGYLR